ncbi:MAG: CRISPR-associated endonuclease Cas2 [Bacteroidetes bacterium]|nr:CRISPR-associated endonuclease Cas2 [Bacteroidota bacterium]
MTRKKKIPFTFPEIIRKLKYAGLSNVDALNTVRSKEPEVEQISERIRKVFHLYKTASAKPDHMIFFIMYDIEHDKIRTQIAKYLLKKGCIRVQKSVFLAQKERKLFDEMHTTLKEIQEMYDNEDSIFFVPISTDELRSMKILGQNVTVDMILENKSTLFF